MYPHFFFIIFFGSFDFDVEFKVDEMSLTSKLTLLGRQNAYALSANIIHERGVHHHMERSDILRYLGIKRSNTAKANRNTHVNEKKFRQLRGRKNVMIELPDYEFERKGKDMYADDMRIAMLKKGINVNKDVAARQWNESQLTMQTFGMSIDNYIPPEDPLPLLPEVSQIISGTKAKASEVGERVKHRWHNYFNGLRIIKKKEGLQNFKTKNFVRDAERIYIDAFKALSERNKLRLLGLITEHCFEKMWPDVENRSLVWEFVEFSQPSQVVAIRAGDFPYKSGNYIAQITVKMHPVIKRAVYDRFGRVLLGHPEETKSNVEYVLFENHISNIDGVWRMHDKVYPSWTQTKDSIHRHDLLARLEDEEDIDRPAGPKKFELGIEDRLRREEKKQREKEAEQDKA
ncbi:unnamed protein product [Bursaphelenchus xylophilus]|uniref:Large ribosomal subunit protein mL45 n=1 Tax=Bursaphelenchus xylophilus TaxID=6326 RepID=A0A1I7STZ6_BURXY|nr:unnamed protein product [Bursaphelenchus xylophilus]CAG9107763.1 unnamed protein product [Bursaphelenchus xylophilus]